MSTESDLFKAIKGQFNKFKRRDMHSVVKYGEAASSNRVVADNFMTEFQEYIEAEEFAPQRVFSCDETDSSGRKCQRGPTSHKRRRSHCWDTRQQRTG